MRRTGEGKSVGCGVVGGGGCGQIIRTLSLNAKACFVLQTTFAVVAVARAAAVVRVGAVFFFTFFCYLTIKFCDKML